jgi:hypothetical protein
VTKPPTEPDELRREIEQTRTQLSETVEALAAKADVKARAHDAVDDAKARAHEAVDEAKARAHEAAEEVRERVHSAVDTLAYQVGKQRERVAKLDPRVRAGLIALVVGLVTVFVVRKVRGRR